MTTWPTLLAGFVLAAGTGTAPPDTGKLVVAETLRAEPFRDARVLAPLKAGENLQIVKRQGGWYQVRSGKRSGWVRMLSVRRAESGKANVVREASGLLDLASGRAGTGKVLATTGIRGLDEEQLKAAAFDAAALVESDGYVKSVEAAASFAARGRLVARRLEYLADPAQTGAGHE
ncbi:MAG: hypothetical protein RLZZ200_9 [Pseudomonadota bacterium]|jgi:hypothetical protein